MQWGLKQHVLPKGICNRVKGLDCSQAVIVERSGRPQGILGRQQIL